MGFLEVVDGLGENPTEVTEKVEGLRTLFLNAHYLINECRPHVAKDGLIAMMEEQLERKRGEVEGVKRMQVRVDEVLDGLKEIDLGNETGGGVKAEGKGRDLDDLKAKRIWQALDKLDV